jgi:hypothetical protein
MMARPSELAGMAANMAVFMIPFVLAGTSNMLFCKSRLLDALKIPIDNGMSIGGKRLFGANKTWKGFIGMIVFSAAWLGIFGDFVDLYFKAGNYWAMGAALGFGYVLLELPNSFIKRRLDIGPGQTGRGIGGLLFSLLDQADSVVGSAIVMALFDRVTLAEIAVFLAVGILVHLVIHKLLLLARLKNYDARPA